MARQFISYCGIYCANCPIFIAGALSDKKKKAQLAKKLSEEMGKKITPEEISCLGCRSSTKSHWTQDCKIRKCASEKGIEFCYQCEEFPCSSLHEFYKKNQEPRENLKKISKVGVDAFLAEIMKNDGRKS